MERGTSREHAPSWRSRLTSMTETKSTMVSNVVKSSVRSLFMGQAMMTRRGIIPAAIWILEPTATPMVSSILPLQAIHTEVTCSAALPT